MPKVHMIVVSSQKGGVGKTTVAVNLAIALKKRGYRVLLIDSDYSNPSVGFHLGMQDANVGFLSVISGRAKLAKAIAIHAPSGVHVLPGEISIKMPQFSRENVRTLEKQIESSGYEFVVLDTAPGPMNQEAMQEFRVLGSLHLILTTPEMPATTSAIRLAHIYGKVHLDHVFVANRVKNKMYELNIGEIEDALGENILASLPEDENIGASIAEHIPIVLLKENSQFSVAIKKLGMRLISRSGAEQAEVMEKESRGGFFAWLRRFLRLDGS